MIQGVLAFRPRIPPVGWSTARSKRQKRAYGRGEDGVASAQKARGVLLYPTWRVELWPSGDGLSSNLK